jgi:hypothetical protein
VTEWGRKAVAPLAKATRCERTHLPEETPAPAPVDVEAALLLTMPLVALPPRTGGWCQLQVESGIDDAEPAGVRIDIEAGRVVSCVSRLDPKPRSWATGSAQVWFEAVSVGDPSRLRFGGADRLPENVIRSLHEALAAAIVPTALAASAGRAVGGLAGGDFADERH